MQKSDLGWLLGKVIKFNDEYGLPPIDVHRTKRTLKEIVYTGVAIRSADAAILGIITPDPFRDRVYLVEVGWYAEDRQGLQLLKQFQQYGRDIMCDEVRMSTLHNSPPQAARILQKIGYTPTEHGWALQL